MCPWLLSPGDAEKTIHMFFALVRSPAAAMQKAPHCAGLFCGRVLGKEGVRGRDPLFAASKRGPLPRVPLCQNLQPTLMHARPAVDTGRRVAFEVGNEDQRDAAGGQLVQQIQILAAGVFVQGGTGLVQQ